MENNINNLKTEKIKVLELVYNAIPPDDADEIISHITLTKDDFERQSISVDKGYSLLKEFHQEKIIKLLSYIDDDFDITLYTNGNNIKEYLNILRKNTSFEKVILDFDKENSVLKIGEAEVKIQLKNDKPNDHYVLEYIFDNSLKEKHYYTDIIESKFPNEKMGWRALYRACENINKKVGNQTNMGSFLTIKSGKTGYTQINSKFA